MKPNQQFRFSHRFNRGCPDSAIISLMDVDGDFVTCRYAVGQKESGTVLNKNPYLGSGVFYFQTVSTFQISTCLS